MYTLKFISNVLHSFGFWLLQKAIIFPFIHSMEIQPSMNIFQYFTQHVTLFKIWPTLTP